MNKPNPLRAEGFDPDDPAVIAAAPGPHLRVSSSADLIGSSLNCARRGPITAGIASALGVWDDCASDSAGPYGR